MPRIFLSYRRSDSSTISGRIYDHLVREYGDDSVFKDVYDIPAGSDFRQVIRDAINACNVQLIIIGTTWVDARSTTGERRLENPDDFVRIEVESGLTCTDILLIPVLVSGASMPSPAELPESLRDLTFRNAVVIRDDPDFRGDIEHLIQSLNRQFAPSVRLERVRRLTPILVATLVFAALVVTTAVLVTREQVQQRINANNTATVVAALAASPTPTVAPTDLPPTLAATPTELTVLAPTPTAKPTELAALPPTPTRRLTATIPVATDPEGAIALIREGDALQSEGRYQEALARYAQAIALDPANAEAYISRASVYGTLGINFEQAILDANRAIELAPEYLWNYDERGKIYYAMGDYEAAVESFTQALQLESYAEGYLKRGSAYQALGDFGNALSDMTLAIALDPSDPDAYQERGWVEYEIGRNGDAIRDFTAAIERDPEASRSYIGRGSAYRDTSNLDRAFDDYERAISLDPNSPFVYSERGYAYQLQEDTEQARADYNHALDLDADFVTAHYRLARLELEADDGDAALKHAQRVVQLASSSPDAYALLGDVYYYLGHYDQALPQYRRYVELAGDAAEEQYLELINELE